MADKEQHHVALDKLEIHVLNCIKRKAQTEKTVARMIGLDIFILSPLITVLILKGYVQTMRRRKLFFFSREYCTITAEGIAALEQARNPFTQIVELIRERAFGILCNLAANSPFLRLLIMSAKPAYKITKALL